ncbi:hypothetical protein [Bacillus sp. CHD6a]|uniref:hypothetical protein n=1 Tax=Bacillus sp. CHD6a TaxID=1643452 RepID=UPI0006CD072B|nr:hypothetical protein [Bacillus sp. CHD6a]KPB03922.1 hypothetical protein AAV98_14965 [Bacillus sp. CHD6a]
MKREHFMLLSLIIIFTSFLLGCTKETEIDWKESALFESGGYTMIGEQERIGFIYEDSDSVRFYPNKEQKYMWHLWGEKEELEGKFKVIATHEEDKESITLLDRHTLGGANNGADQHVPSMMSLPESGLWKLDAYVGDNLFGTVFVKVHEKE